MGLQSIYLMLGLVDLYTCILVGLNTIIQIDVTTLNYKFKTHVFKLYWLNRCYQIVEFKKNIMWGFAVLFRTKKSKLYCYFIFQVNINSTIRTGEHRSYASYNIHNFTYDTVCYKCNYIDEMTGAHAQVVASFSSQLKLENNGIKVIKTGFNQQFFDEFCWKYNNMLFALKNTYFIKIG